jgi:hypothetical protein
MPMPPRPGGVAMAAMVSVGGRGIAESLPPLPTLSPKGEKGRE